MTTPARRHGLAALLAVSGGLTLGLAVHLGWGRGRSGGRARPWQVATGWDRVPAAPAPRAVLALAPDDAVRLDWLGHSGFLLSWHGTRLLVDPHLAPRCSVSPRLLESPPGLPQGAGDLPAADAVLLTHAHYDHLDLATLARLRALPRLLLPAGSEGYLRSLEGAAGRVAGLLPGASTDVGALRVSAVPARHGGSRHHPLGGGRRAVGWVVEAGGHAVYFAGDTGYGPHFAAVGRSYRPTLAILPIGAFSPAFPIGRVHLSPEQAVRAALELGAGGAPPRVVPCHFGTFVLSLDRPAAALPRFARAARRAGIRWSMPALLGAVA